MSDQPPPAKKPRLSKFGSAHARKQGGDVKSKTKAHKFDATQYHQNANRRSIHALVKFDCPICQCKNTVMVDLDSKRHTATVRCTYCLSLKPRPAELPYPFTTPFTPRLENKADAFFRFSEKYRALVQHSSSSSSPPSAPTGGGEGGTARGITTGSPTSFPMESTAPGAGVQGGGGAAAPSALEGGLLDNLDEILAASLEGDHPVEGETTHPSPHHDGNVSNDREDGDDKGMHGNNATNDDKESEHTGGKEGDVEEEEEEELVDDVDAFFNDE